MTTSPFGDTRSAHHLDHLLQTPETFVRAPLPGMAKATAIVHVAPAAGARFVQYTAEFDEGGLLGPCVDQRFVYLLEGRLSVGGAVLTEGDFAYLPPGDAAVVIATGVARAAVFEKPYQPLEGKPTPAPLVGRESGIAPVNLEGDPWLEVRSLVPDDSAFDFRVNTMTYQPGASLRGARDSRDGARAADVERRRHLPARFALVSGAGRRLHLDGRLLSAVVRRARQDAREVPDLQGLGSTPAMTPTVEQDRLWTS